MVTINYGDSISEDIAFRIATLMKSSDSFYESGLSKDIFLQIIKLTGDTVLNIASGKTIEEASRCLPTNTNETIGEAAVLIRATANYQFNPKELAYLIRYFDSYPMDPRITWGYTHESNQENPIEIFILKNIKTKTNETN